MSFVPLTTIIENTQGMPDPHVSGELRSTRMGTQLKPKKMNIVEGHFYVHHSSQLWIQSSVLGMKEGRGQKKENRHYV